MVDKSDSSAGSAAVDSGSQAVKDLIEKVFLAGMGAAAVTKDRVQELVQELVDKGQVNAEDGREIVERLVSRSREEARSLLGKADSSLQSAYRGLGIGSKQEMEDLRVRIEQLEHRIRLLEDAGDGPKADS